MAVLSHGRLAAAPRRAALLPLALALLCGQCLGAEHAHGSHAAGTAKLPGEMGYYTKLKLIHARDGVLKRKNDDGDLVADFKPDAEYYELHIEDPNLEVTGLMLELDLSKYNLMYTPTIYFNNEKVEYSPLNEIFVHFPLNDTAGPVDKEVEVKVADPASAGGFFGEVADIYTIRVTQDANAQAVQLQELKVVGSDGKALKSYPDFHTDAPARKVHEYRYFIEHDETEVTATAKCPNIPGETKEYGGVASPVDSSQVVDVEGKFVTKLQVMCIYHDERVSRTTSEVLLILQKKVKRTEASKFLKTFEVLPEYGYCDPTDRESRHEPAPGIEEGPGFRCRADKEDSEFIATFKEKTGFGTLTDPMLNEARTLTNDLPTLVPMAHRRQHLRLRIDTGNTIVEHPITVIWPAHCHSMTCPDGLSWRTFDKYIAREHMCKNEKCGDGDVDHCCAEPAACSTYSFPCKPGFELRPGAEKVKCASDECFEDDEDTCCEDSSKIDPKPERTVVAPKPGMNIWVRNEESRMERGIIVEGPMESGAWKAKFLDITGQSWVEKEVMLKQGVIVLVPAPGVVMGGVDGSGAAAGGTIVMVSGLAEGTEKQDVVDAFNDYGKIVHTELKEKNGEASVEYEDAKAAKTAAASMDGKEINGQAVHVEQSGVADGHTILLSGLAEHTKQADIEGACSEYGQVVHTELDSEEGEASVEFEDSETAKAAVKGMDGMSLNGATLHAEQEKPEGGVGEKAGMYKGRKGYISMPPFANGSMQLTLYVQKDGHFEEGDKVVVYGTNATIYHGPDGQGFYKVKYGDGLISFPMPEFVIRKLVTHKPKKGHHNGDNETVELRFTVGQQVLAEQRIAVVVYADKNGYIVNFADDSSQSGLLHEESIIGLSKLEAAAALRSIRRTELPRGRSTSSPLLGVAAGAIATGFGVMLAASVRCGLRRARGGPRTASARYAELELLPGLEGRI